MRHVWTPDLLLPFDYEEEGAGRLAIDRTNCVEGSEPRDEFPLVVFGATGVEGTSS